MYAVISDVHSNIEALSAVFADLDDIGVPDILDEIWDGYFRFAPD